MEKLISPPLFLAHQNDSVWQRCPEHRLKKRHKGPLKKWFPSLKRFFKAKIRNYNDINVGRFAPPQCSLFPSQCYWNPYLGKADTMLSNGTITMESLKPPPPPERKMGWSYPANIHRPPPAFPLLPNFKISPTRPPPSVIRSWYLTYRLSAWAS